MDCLGKACNIGEDGGLPLGRDRTRAVLEGAVRELESFRRTYRTLVLESQALTRMVSEVKKNGDRDRAWREEDKEKTVREVRRRRRGETSGACQGLLSCHASLPPTTIPRFNLIVRPFPLFFSPT